MFRIRFQVHVSLTSGLISPQRPKRATAESMTRFHTDEYIHFLERVTPETAEQLTYHGNRCELHPSSQSDLWLMITYSVSPHWRGQPRVRGALRVLLHLSWRFHCRSTTYRVGVIRYSNQLGRRTPSRKETGSLRILLRQ